MAGRLHKLPFQLTCNTPLILQTGRSNRASLPPHVPPPTHLKPPRVSPKKGYSTSLRNIRAHTHIRGKNLADAAAKLSVTDCDTLPSEQTMRVEIGAMAPRPPSWLMYTANHPTPTHALATGPRQATLRPPWWTFPEADRLQIHAFTRPSHKMRQKVRAATLRSMHQTSI